MAKDHQSFTDELKEGRTKHGRLGEGSPVLPPNEDLSAGSAFVAHSPHRRLRKPRWMPADGFKVGNQTARPGRGLSSRLGSPGQRRQLPR